MELKIFLQPRASRNQVLGWHDGELKIAVTSPPVEGAANKHIIEYIAKILDMPKSKISILHGEKSRHKLLMIAGDDNAVMKRIEQSLLIRRV